MACLSVEKRKAYCTKFMEILKSRKATSSGKKAVTVKNLKEKLKTWVIKKVQWPRQNSGEGR